MLKGIGGVILIAAMTGCAGADQGFNYQTQVDGTVEFNKALIELEKVKIKAFSDLQKTMLENQQALKLKKVEMKMAKGKPATKPQGISITHCEQYRDEYPNQFALCLEREIEKSSDINQGKEVTEGVAVSGDSNVIVIGSSGVDIQQGGGKSDPGPAGEILDMIKENPLVPIPAPRLAQNPVDPWLDFGKSALQAGLYGFLGHTVADNIGAALSAGAARDSIGGDVTQGSFNPATTNITPIAD